MSKCSNCKIEILDNTDRCPLCLLVIENKNEQSENMYPDVRTTTRKVKVFANIILFLSIIAITVLLYINSLVTPDFWWSLIAAMAIVYCNVVLRVTVIGKSGYMGRILSFTLFAVLLLVGMDYVIGYQGWGLSFGLPIGTITIDIGILLLMIINRRNWQSYMMMQLFTVGISIIQLLLVLLGVINFPYIVYGASALSGFIFLGTLIIGDDRARTELKRRFYV